MPYTHFPEVSCVVASVCAIPFAGIVLGVVVLLLAPLSFLMRRPTPKEATTSASAH